MGHVTKERHWSNNYQHLFINWEAKEIDHSIFIKACKDFANVLSDTRVSEKYVDAVIMACRFGSCEEGFSEKEKRKLLESWFDCIDQPGLENITFSYFRNKRLFQTPGQDVSRPETVSTFWKAYKLDPCLILSQVMELNLKIMSGDWIQRL